MDNTKQMYETGEIALDSGKFVCKAGISKDINKDDVFPVCPISHNDTTWELVD